MPDGCRSFSGEEDWQGITSRPYLKGRKRW